MFHEPSRHRLLHSAKPEFEASSLGGNSQAIDMAHHHHHHLPAYIRFCPEGKQPNKDSWYPENKNLFLALNFPYNRASFLARAMLKHGTHEKTVLCASFDGNHGKSLVGMFLFFSHRTYSTVDGFLLLVDWRTCTHKKHGIKQ